MQKGKGQSSVLYRESGNPYLYVPGTLLCDLQSSASGAGRFHGPESGGFHPGGAGYGLYGPEAGTVDEGRREPGRAAFPVPAGVRLLYHGGDQPAAALRKLPPLEYAKRKADYLFGFKQYGRAVAGYEKILESYLAQKADDAFLGKVWNNLGACYARIFQFDKALGAYDRAYGKLKDVSVLERIYHLTLMSPDISLKERYQSIITDEMKAAWDEDFAKAKKEADQSDGIKKLEEMFSRDPIRRMEGARQTLEAWKQEYRGTA